MNIKMTQEQFEAYLRSLPEGPEGDVVIDKNTPAVSAPVYVYQGQNVTDPVLQELYRQKDELEEQLEDLELEEPMEIDYDSYDLYESVYSEWQEQMDEMKEKITEFDRQIGLRS